MVLLSLSVKSCFHGQSALGCCLESLGVTSVGALYHDVASEEPDSNDGVQYFLAAQEHGGARSGACPDEPERQNST
eukprot:scaffold41482_cov475-Skeletonema_marinoi.AAC.1